MTSDWTSRPSYLHFSSPAKANKLCRRHLPCLQPLKRKESCKMQTKAKVNFKFTKFVILLFYEGFQILPSTPGPAWVTSRRESQIKLSTHYTVSIWRGTENVLIITILTWKYHPMGEESQEFIAQWECLIGVVYHSPGAGPEPIIGCQETWEHGSSRLLQLAPGCSLLPQMSDSDFIASLPHVGLLTNIKTSHNPNCQFVLAWKSALL